MMLMTMLTVTWHNCCPALDFSSLLLLCPFAFPFPIAADPLKVSIHGRSNGQRKRGREREGKREGVALIGRCSHYRVKYFRSYLANSQRSHHTQLDRDLLKGLPSYCKVCNTRDVFWGLLRTCNCQLAFSLAAISIYYFLLLVLSIFFSPLGG